MVLRSSEKIHKYYGAAPPPLYTVQHSKQVGGGGIFFAAASNFHTEFIVGESKQENATECGKGAQIRLGEDVVGGGWGGGD